MRLQKGREPRTASYPTTRLFIRARKAGIIAPSSVSVGYVVRRRGPKREHEQSTLPRGCPRNCCSERANRHWETGKAGHAP